jgi:uncharacterized beta barrel domain-containing protein DUF5777
MLRRISLSALVFSVILLAAAPSYALPQFLQRFAADPFSRPELRTQCSTCHVNPNGGGTRNPFGMAFEKNDKTITPELRAAWPDHFLPSVAPAPVASQAGDVKATFLANGSEAIVQIGGEYFHLDAKQAKLEKIEQREVAQLTGQPAGGQTSTSASAKPAETKVPLRDQPTFDHYLINLPTTLPYQRKALSMRFTHRFSQPVLRVGGDCVECADASDLLGLDSFSYSSLGAEYGITGRLAATIYRSPLDKDWEFGGVLQLSKQQGREPISSSLRISMETRRFFVVKLGGGGNERFQTLNLALPMSHAISNVAELFVAPMLSIRANPDPPARNSFVSEGDLRRNLGAIELGASIRFRPRTAFVTEWMPRVGGYHATDSRNAVSFGIQRTTNGHVFELVLTNTLGTSTSAAVAGGTRDFMLGFNIYRRLR